MSLLNQIKLFNSIPPGVIKDNAAFVSNVIDKQSFLDQGAKGILFIALLGVTDVTIAVLKVMQSDTKTNGTTLGGTPTEVHDFSTKPSATADNDLYAVYIPMANWANRYLQLQATAGDGTAGTYLAAIAIADKDGDGAATAAGINADVLEID